LTIGATEHFSALCQNTRLVSCMVCVPTILPLARCQEAPILGTKLICGHSPLIGARIESTNSTPRNHDIKLPVIDIIANVCRLNNHDLPPESCCPSVCTVPALASERQLEAFATYIACRRHGCETICMSVIDAPRYIIMACESRPIAGTTTCTGDAWIVLFHIILVARAERSHFTEDIACPTTMRLATIPIASSISCVNILVHAEQQACCCGRNATHGPRCKRHDLR